ncbi:MAG: hypothetical protein HFJ18_02010 [Clostridia bacterium]|nr:hypothetical protein [Clostridia bacterium]
MKKVIIILIIFAIIIITSLMLVISQYRSERNEINRFNLEYEQYKDKTIYGTNIGSLINYAINNNEKYNIEKDENENYIDDDKYCLRIEIRMLSSEDEEKIITYSMETINSLGIERFVKNFNVLDFKCVDINYNSYGRVNKLVFELIS